MSDASSPQVVHLPTSMTVREAEATHALLCRALAAGTDIVLDCSSAEDIDLSHLQLLIAAQRSAVGLGKAFALSAPASGVLLEALVRGGFVDPARPAEAFWTSRSPQSR